jgi:hypothetical protein
MDLKPQICDKCITESRTKAIRELLKFGEGPAAKHARPVHFVEKCCNTVTWTEPLSSALRLTWSRIV